MPDFKRPCQVPCSLCLGWEANVASSAGRVQALAKSAGVRGIFFGDELSCDDKLSFAHYSAVTAAFRKALGPGPLFWANECHPGLALHQ